MKRNRENFQLQLCDSVLKIKCWPVFKQDPFLFTYILCQCRNARGEPREVRLQPATGVPLPGQPAVVQRHQVVAGLQVPLRHYDVRHLLEQVLAASKRAGEGIIFFFEGIYFQENFI